jgi:hypothetical protein
MKIIAKVRPMGLKKGVRTEAYYKALGFKKEYVDVRDVVGTLTLSASGPKDIEFLAILHRAISTYDGSFVRIFALDGTLLAGSNEPIISALPVSEPTS